jgi:hypothetical protein
VQGSSALQEVLENVEGRVDVFAVWEPILPTDLLAPGTDTLARLHDSRVWQVWDRGHLLSDEMRTGMKAHPSAIALETRRLDGRVNGILWDAVAIFGPKAKWTETLPAPAYLDGDVVDIAGAVEDQLKQMTRSSGSAN